MANEHRQEPLASPRQPATAVASRPAAGGLMPRLVLRIGITGHRTASGKLDEADIPPLRAAIAAALGSLRAGLHDLHSDRAYAGVFLQDEPKLRVISSLAEGADRAAAAAALDLGCDLECPLPFPREEYAKDFPEAASKSEFFSLLKRAHSVFELPGTRSEAERSYQSAGLVMLRQADIVLAIWNGETGKRGGTAEMVQHAVRAQIPVVFFNPKERLPRLIHAEGYSTHDARDLARNARVQTAPDLAALARRMTLPPGVPKGDASPEGSARWRLERFLGERIDRTFNPWLAYSLFLAAFGVRKFHRRDAFPSQYLETMEGQWSGLIETLDARGIKDHSALRNVILPRYAAADALSVHLGHIYRSSYILSFTFSALAVAFALVGLVVSDVPKTFWLAMELLSIGVVFFIANRADKGEWHVRWLDYRQLAEQLRHAAILSLLGSGPIGLGTRRVTEDGEAGPLWVNWYVRATAREVSLPLGLVDQTYLLGAQEALRRAEIADQIAYHRSNHHRLETLHHRLHTFGHFLLGLTVVICAGFLLGEFTHLIHLKEWKYWLAFVCGVLPAFGATLFAIRVQGDFEGAAARSEAMAERLSQLEADLARPITDYMELLLTAEAAAGSMFSELSDWRYVYRGKPIAML